MSAEVESMAYAGEVPWHGLGKQVEPWLPTGEAIKAAGVDWGVTTEPIYERFVGGEGEGDGATRFYDYRPIDRYMRTVRSTDNRTLGIVRSKYVPIQNTNVFDWFNEFIEHRLAYIEAAGSLRGGRIVWCLARVNMEAVTPVDGDEIRPYLLLSNSHDGTKAARVGFTEIRVVCMNTLMAAHGVEDSDLIRVLHKGDATERLENTRNAFMELYQGTQKRAVTYAKLAVTKITMTKLDEYIAAVFNIKPRDDGQTGRGRGLVEKVRARFFEELDRSGMTWWSAYNAVTAYLSHDAGRTDDSRYEALWFGQGGKKLTSALALAVAMAGV